VDTQRFAVRATFVIILTLLAAIAAAEAQAESSRAVQVSTEAHAAGSPQTSAPTGGHELQGLASWYAGKFQGRTTASGEVFDTNLLTAAHKTLPFGTVVRVTHLENGRSVEVRINDRGPFVEGRVIDLSRAAAEAIGMTGEGIAAVELTIVEHPEPPTYRIQVASFSSAGNAERTRARLAREDLGPRIEETGDVFRVVIPGLTADAIPPLREHLASLGFPAVLVRRE
jgi:rare lipoprotein A